MEILVKELINSISESHRVLGSTDRCVRNVKPIDQADADSLCFCKEKGKRASEMIGNSKAMVIVCSDSLEFTEGEFKAKTLIQVANPRLTYSRLLAKYYFQRPEPFIHSDVVIDKRARIGHNVHIGPNSYIGDCEIGDGTVIEGHVYINTGTKIGNGVIVHPGVVIGTEAAAFERNEKGELEWFPQISGVIIEDDVEIGANSIICRGSLSNTVVGKGTKIDALVHVAHGTIIGKHCIILAGSVICGSVKIGDNTWISPLACIRESLNIGNNVLVGTASVVHKDIPDNLTVMGSPARPTLKRDN